MLSLLFKLAGVKLRQFDCPPGEHRFDADGLSV
jgi:hypothetical protein